MSSCKHTHTNPSIEYTRKEAEIFFFFFTKIQKIIEVYKT